MLCIHEEGPDLSGPAVRRITGLTLVESRIIPMTNAANGQDKHPSRKHPHRLSGEAYHERHVPMLVTIRTRDGLPFLLGRGIPDKLTATLVASAEAHGCAVIAYCIMPEHVHFLACVSERGGDLLNFIRRFKSQVTRDLRELGVPAPVWQRSFHDKTARTDAALATMVEYVLANASAAGLCGESEEWPWAAFHGYPWDEA